MWPPEKCDELPPDHPAPDRRHFSLTAIRIDNLTPRARPYEVTDPSFAALTLRIARSGTKSWIFRYSGEKGRTCLQLGVWPDTGLELARERAQLVRYTLSLGLDPRDAGIVPAHKRPYPSRKRKPALVQPSPRRPPPPETDLSDDPNDVPSDRYSVKYLAHEFYHRHIINERRYMWPKAVQYMLNHDILPYWAGRDARSITPEEVVSLLDRIVARGAKVMANRVGITLGHMFRYALHRRIVTQTPVLLLYKPGGFEHSRERVFSATELKIFLLNYRTLNVAPRMAHAWMILLLTLQRRQEIALARKSDFDLDAATWTIPDEHSKGRRDRRRGQVVPLSAWAVEEVRALMALTGPCPYLLPNKNGSRSLDPRLMSQKVRDAQGQFRALGIQPWTLHDLRRTGRTGLAALGVEDAMAERILNHRLEPKKRVYNLYAYLEEKRDALDRWAAHLRTVLADAQAEQTATQRGGLDGEDHRDVASGGAR